VGTSTSRRAPAGLAAAALLLAGCAQGAPAATSTAPLTAESSAAASASTDPAAAASSAAEASRAAAQYAANRPTDAARMVCGDEIVRLVTGALELPARPVPRATWADHVYTCTYPLAKGPLVLAVAVAPSDAAAATVLATMRQEKKADTVEQAVGQTAFSSDDGVIVSVKDNMVLLVDPSRLPDDLGPVHEHRIDLARILTVAVFNCWTGN
jgi:hypothetical protein